MRTFTSALINAIEQALVPLLMLDNPSALTVLLPLPPLDDIADNLSELIGYSFLNHKANKP